MVRKYEFWRWFFIWIICVTQIWCVEAKTVSFLGGADDGR